MNNNLGRMLQFIVFKAHFISTLPNGPANAGKAKCVDRCPPRKPPVHLNTIIYDISRNISRPKIEAHNSPDDFGH